MATDRRIEFSQNWFRRAHDSSDPFDRFFYAWIALVVAAKRISNRREDRGKILEYFSYNHHKVLKAMESNLEHWKALASRRSNRIVTTGNFRRLSEHFREINSLPQNELVCEAGRFLNHVRNNLFHGEKVYESHDDNELLQLVNPILLTILKECEGFVDEGR